MEGRGQGLRKKYGDDLLIETVQTRLHGHLLHVTDRTHLASIETHGLLSPRSARELGVAPRYPGGNALSRSLDAHYGYDNMVFLSFFNLGLMPKYEDARQRQPVLLKIDARILWIHGVKVALGRANRSRTDVYKPARAFYEMDWEIILGPTDDMNTDHRVRLLRACDYEILVPDRVPIEYILGIA
jgi:hypothetical protein